MPGTQTTGSTNISLLDSKIVANTCIGKFYVDLTPSIYIGSGNDNVLGANVQIKNPLGVIVKPYGSNYEIAPALSQGMDAAVVFNIPTQGGTYQFGTYTFDVQLFDSNGDSWVVSKTVKICEPDQKNITRNYATLSAQLNGVCKDGKLFVIVNNTPTYNGKNVESQSNDFTLEYPTGSGLPKLSSSITSFSVKLFEGVYKFSGTICALYNMGDNVYIQILYKVKTEKNVKCIIDFCCVNDQFTALKAKLDTDCTPDEKANTAAIMVEALFYLETAKLSAECGQDPSDVIDSLEKLLGCSCTCVCNEGTPVIDITPSNDVVIEGCGFDVESVGLTKKYTLYNHKYVIQVNPEASNFIYISNPVVNNCVSYQTIQFDIYAVYNQIKEYALQQSCEWAAIIKRCLIGLDVSCLGISPTQYATMTLLELFQAMVNASCTSSVCNAVVSNVKVTLIGVDVKFEWDESGNVFSVDIYLGNHFIANVLGGIKEYIAIASAVHDTSRIYNLVPKCANGSIGTPSTGQINFTGKVFIAPPQIYTPNLHGNCPYDLNTNILPLPLGVTTEWHTANNTSSETLVPDPSQALQGTYYLFAKDNNNFYSTGVQVTLVCEISGSCSAPQNLSVVPAFGGNIIQFQSAAYAPPGNSYTVKRRVKSDIDIAGNYTTIGTPVFNASASRWVINDATAVANVLYVYRAISNCGGTSPYIDFEFASIVCPTLTFTPKVREIDYRFTNSGGQIDKYEVSIYADDQFTIIHTNTHVPVFSNPITGMFLYLDPNKNYYVKVKAYIGNYVKDCGFVVASTYSDTATLIIDYIAGRFMATLNNPLTQQLTLSSTMVKGSNSSICGSTLESDIMPSIIIPASQLSAEQQTNGITYLSTYYSIDDGVTISGYGSKSNGDTFTVDGCVVTVQINHRGCGFYPA